MERTLYTERLYSLGDFKNIKFSTALTNIPEELAMNEKVVGLLYMQQFLGCEIAYRRYYDLIQKLTKDNVQNVVEYLENERNQTMKELYEEIRAAGGTVAGENKKELVETQEKETK